ncbi:putative PurR-regulated permease PerM [Clostridium moniliforme]|uniref:PurR-regulated permease PerM n=1 Tax=Clostridium moniliforme TaxID=39489 RepID=A0ABS4EYE2_9CLOT|nr:AI-2E family transporter [Clostridium moniliforme]MBP1889023.1 putative PurR-regulated permease PerM [Clostridium moniliforme]
MKYIKNNLKPYMLIATYIIVLAYIVLNLSTVWTFLGKILGILSPFLLAIAIAFVLNIPMKLIENKILKFMDNSKKFPFLKYFKRALSIVITILLVVSLLTTLIIFVIPQLVDSFSKLIDSVPSYVQSFEHLVTSNLGNFQGFDKVWNDILNAWKDVLSFAGQFLGVTLNRLVNITVSLTSGVVNFFLAVIFAIYMLASKEVLIFQCKKLLYAHLKEKTANYILKVGRLSNETFQKFIAGQCTEAVIIGTLCFIGMLILKLPYALLIGFIVGVTSLIPIFGAFLGTIPSAFLIFIINPIKALVFIIFIIVLQQFEGHLIYPKVVGNYIGLSAIWVMFAMLVGGSLLGFVGLLIGIPLFGVIYKLLKENTNNKLISKELSNKDILNK